MTMRFLAVVVLPVALATSCSTPPTFEIDNRSGQNVVLEIASEAPRMVEAGHLAGGLRLNTHPAVRVGACTYSYNDLDVELAEPRRNAPPALVYHVRLDPDFSLHLFNTEYDGRLGDEIQLGGWPARPQVDCRTKG